jgi:hypothetical protein
VALARKENTRRQTAKRSAQRRQARENTACQHCGTPIAAERSDRRYCSGRCRVAGFRARRASAL